MSRQQIIIICVVIIIVWTGGKWLINRLKPKKQEEVKEHEDVESWYSRAQDRIAAMYDETLKEREAAWEALSDDEKLRISDEFILDAFGPQQNRKLRVEEKLKIGKARSILEE